MSLPDGVTDAKLVPWSKHFIFIGVKNHPGKNMALNITDPRAEKVVRELAAAGESVTAAVRKAAEERLQRIRRDRGGHSLADELLEIGARCAALPDADTRSADEILGYDRHGLPN